MPIRSPEGDIKRNFTRGLTCLNKKSQIASLDSQTLLVISLCFTLKLACWRSIIFSSHFKELLRRALLDPAPGQ
jgi:hypothetical protein